MPPSPLVLQHVIQRGNDRQPCLSEADYLNPLRAAMVVDPHDYTCLSHLANAYGHHDPLVTPHSACLALSSDLIQRQLTYRGLVMEMLDPAEIEAIH